MKFHTHFRFHKDKKVIPPGKNLIFQKKLEIFSKIRFLELAKSFFHWCTNFGFTWCTLLGFMILQKPHVLRKPPSQVICKIILRQSNCKIFQVSISQELFEVWSYFSCKLQFDHVTFFGFRQACPKCSEKNQQYRFWGKIWCINVVLWF